MSTPWALTNLKVCLLKKDRRKTNNDAVGLRCSGQIMERKCIILWAVGYPSKHQASESVQSRLTLVKTSVSRSQSPEPGKASSEGKQAENALGKESPKAKLPKDLPSKGQAEHGKLTHLLRPGETRGKPNRSASIQEHFNAKSPWQRNFQEVIPQSPPGADPNGTLIPKLSR